MQIRPYQGGDEAALLKIWERAMPHDRLAANLFRTQILLDANFLPANLPVALVDGQIVGFVLALTRQVPLFLQGLEPDKAWITAFGVDPAYRRQGVGTALFEHVLKRLSREGRKSLAIAPYVPNYIVPGVDVDAYPGTVEFLEEKIGFTTQSRAISMGADLTGFVLPPDIGEAIEEQRQQGLQVEPVSPADLPELMPFLVDHFGWDWYRHAQSYLLEYFGGEPHRICFLVARLNGEIVGFCQQRNERFGPFGVRPDCRGRGIGRILLCKCLETMSARQVFYSYFLWTGEDAARLYGLAGFKRRREFAVLHKEL
ncbi:MAG: GNAT family N-acetyltransferase [Candidatus Latescibacteria bacterium]|nr:GNAT family N-acetyltransferase [Candidatus Latescibacterota bacterium]